jgi:hypothetical protein
MRGSVKLCCCKFEHSESSLKLNLCGAVRSRMCSGALQRHRNKYSQKRNCAALTPISLSCVCERFIYSCDWSAYSAALAYVDRSCEYINRSETHEWAAQFLFWEHINGFLLQCVGASRRCSSYGKIVILDHIFTFSSEAVVPKRWGNLWS